MKPICIFYHALFKLGDPPQVLPAALNVIEAQMTALRSSGLSERASQIIVGINGGEESKALAAAILPDNANLVFHGLQCHNECRTIRILEDWLPGHEDWYVLYHHSKGATHEPGHDFSARWRKCMQKHVITNWRLCVAALDEGYDAAGVHWMEPPATPVGQYIFAGTFWWAKAAYLKTLPSIMERDRIKVSGLDSAESRYEAEVWIGNGPVRPRVKDFHPNWNPSKIGTCTA